MVALVLHILQTLEYCVEDSPIYNNMLWNNNDKRAGMGNANKWGPGYNV